jgi:endogenous inhibitor of DNA gyrase (YacG/DUF329 family)
MIRCPICQRRLSPFQQHPHAPICSEACRREALRRAGVAEAGGDDDQPPAEAFEEFRATHLFCRTCGCSMPTRERLLLTLPGGELYGYTCAQCGADVGSRTDARPHRAA